MEVKVITIQSENLIETNTNEMITDLPIEYLREKRKESKHISYEGLEIVLGERIPNESYICVNVFNTNKLKDEELEMIVKEIRSIERKISKVLKKD